MEIKVSPIAQEKRKAKPTDESQLGFGKIFTDHLFTMKYHDTRGWYDPHIESYHPFSLDPTAMCFHYGQEIFEGLKAYRGKNGEIYLFRPEENIKRMNASAERLCMPALDIELVLEAIKKLALLEKDWIPHGKGTSLYIRPTMIATEPALGVRPSNEYLFFIVLSPVGAYYPEGFNPTKIFVSQDHVRSVRGGTGACKAGGNYAASLYAGQIAKNMGYTQVLWLDAIERRYIEEVGTSNVFFVIGDELITPPLSGSILPGITRDTVIKIAKRWGINFSERPLSMDEFIGTLGEGKLKEAFASGTAAIISPIGTIYYQKKEYLINNGAPGALSKKLFDEILQIQYGYKDDPFGWRMQIS
jgi:branched-chain amino acid aminotransferase